VCCVQINGSLVLGETHERTVSLLKGQPSVAIVVQRDFASPTTSPDRSSYSGSSTQRVTPEKPRSPARPAVNPTGSPCSDNIHRERKCSAIQLAQWQFAGVAISNAKILICDRLPYVEFPVKSVLVFITVNGNNVRTFTHIFPKIPEKLNFEHNKCESVIIGKTALKCKINN